MSDDASGRKVCDRSSPPRFSAAEWNPNTLHAPARCQDKPFWETLSDVAGVAKSRPRPMHALAVHGARIAAAHSKRTSASVKRVHGTFPVRHAPTAPRATLRISHAIQARASTAGAKRTGAACACTPVAMSTWREPLPRVRAGRACGIRALAAASADSARTAASRAVAGAANGSAGAVRVAGLVANAAACGAL